MDSGRKILHLPSAGTDMGIAGSCWTLRPDRWQATTVDSEPADTRVSSSWQRRQTSLRSWPDQAWNPVPLRSQYWRVRSVFLRLVRRDDQLLQGWTVDRLRCLSRRCSLAEQTRRKRAAAPHRSTDLCNQSTLVAGWKTVIVQGRADGRTQQNLLDIGRRRHPGATAGGRCCSSV